jgi:hypothetical protein
VLLLLLLLLVVESCSQLTFFYPKILTANTNSHQLNPQQHL